MNNGILINENNCKLRRIEFARSCKLIGVKFIIHNNRGKVYNTAGEIESNYYNPVEVWGIMEEHPTQQTMRKLGWDAQLLESAIIIQVPYDTEIQQGSIVEVPSGIDNAEGRLFQVTKMLTTMIYPVYVSCELVPYYESTFSRADLNYTNTNFNLLNGED